ncbi:MAG: metallophosphoesterase [Victivallales bacterium]|nr:metallophosphoesterase [Victivallales bacterium]
MAARRIVLVSDSHVTSGGQFEDDFRSMLEALSRTDHDVMFLGDIMDLWIGMDGYEDALQRWFVEWCKAESSRRKIVYIEGNHEFYVADRYNNVICTAIENRFQDNSLVAEHGHNILGNSIGFNRLFIAFCKSGFARLVLSALPCGQRLALWIKRKFGSNGRTFFSVLPNETLIAWAEGVAAKTGAKDIFIGHFHTAQEFELSDGVRFRVIPAWKNAQEVMLFDTASRNATICNWRTIPPT